MARRRADFFHTEYRMNHRLFTYAKPIVAFMDGITMGGGVGLSQPAKYRVATENTRLAMPETGIGLFPDVGGGWYLSRLPGRTGQYLALTGHRLDGAECLALGLASHYLPSDRLDEAKARIAAEPQQIAAILDELAVPAPDARILAHRDAIDRLFASDLLEDIFAALEADSGEWAQAATRHPAHQIAPDDEGLAPPAPRRRDDADLRGRDAPGICRRRSCRAAPRFPRGCPRGDRRQGQRPRWDPPTPEGVTDHVIDQIFAPLPDGEAWTPA